MKERPILFSAPMVRAILEGKKTQTRRIVKLPPGGSISVEEREDGSFWPWMYDSERNADYWLPCPYGKEKDGLWVRETFRICGEGPGEKLKLFAKDDIQYFADRDERYIGPYHPSIHMPRWASRIQLEITGIRVERLQAISEEDAEAEGCESLDSEREEHDWKICPQCGGTRLYTALGENYGTLPDTDCFMCDTYAKRYRHLWESINGAGSWDANPWVWVISFRRIKP